MKSALSKWVCVAMIWIVTLAATDTCELGAQESIVSLQPNGNFETDADQDQWPDGWGKLNRGGSWQTEDGNRFIRMTSTEPGEMVMLYQEVAIPAAVEAIELRWRERVSDLQIGKQAWFDARILLEFLDADRQPITPAPSTPSTRRNTAGWIEKRSAFLVPPGARTLKFMPCLFQVAAGTFDFDDVAIESTDATPIRQAQEVLVQERQKKLAVQRQARGAKAASLLKSANNLITNGNFEGHKNRDQWPDDWGKLKAGGSWEAEAGNHFLRMRSPSPGQTIMVYRVFDLPPDVPALQLSWRQRVSDLVVGTSPWFDARIMLEFQDIAGKKLQQSPSPVYTQKNSEGWIDKQTQFLVPKDAVALVLMPSLFQVKQGIFDLDDFVLRPTEAAPLAAAAAKRAAEIAARYVPPEEPKPSQWPLMLKVVGNRVQDTQGRNVWLQGVNAGGLETLPHDRQVIKSVVVAIDDWKANCVRVPMNETFWNGKSPYQSDGGKEYRDIIDQIITLAANRGAYVVIDLHRFRAPKQEHADFWKEFAALYRDHPAVLFDLFNEPHGITWDVWKHGGFVGEKEGQDESAFLSEAEKARNQGFQSIGMQGLIDAVRETGAKNIVIAGGLFWCNDLSGITKGYALDDRQGNGIMYSWHTYNWHKDWEAKMLATSREHPIFLGEVGADAKKMDFIPADDQEDPFTWVPDMLGFIQKHQLHWTGWCLHPAASPVMISDWSYTPTKFWGEFAKEALAGKQFELKRPR